MRPKSEATTSDAQREGRRRVSRRFNPRNAPPATNASKPKKPMRSSPGQPAQLAAAKRSAAARPEMPAKAATIVRSRARTGRKHSLAALRAAAGRFDGSDGSVASAVVSADGKRTAGDTSRCVSSDAVATVLSSALSGDFSTGPSAASGARASSRAASSGAAGTASTPGAFCSTVAAASGPTASTGTSSTAAVGSVAGVVSAASFAVSERVTGCAFGVAAAMGAEDSRSPSTSSITLLSAPRIGEASLSRVASAAMSTSGSSGSSGFSPCSSSDSAIGSSAETAFSH